METEKTLLEKALQEAEEAHSDLRNKTQVSEVGVLCHSFLVYIRKHRSHHSSSYRVNRPDSETHHVLCFLGPNPGDGRTVVCCHDNKHKFHQGDGAAARRRSTAGVSSRVLKKHQADPPAATCLHWK